MDDDVQRARLDSARRVATVLLLANLLVMLVGFTIPDHPASPWLRAFSEAALVGGLADWFAVTALFRHPLGLRIPHTAILAANRDRLADGIAHFLEQNFLIPEVLERELAAIDAASQFGEWLSSPVHRRWLVSHTLRLGGDCLHAGPLLAEILRQLVQQGRHRLWFDHLLALTLQALDDHQLFIYRKVSQKSPRWMPRRFNDEFFQRLVAGMAELLADMQEPGSAARRQFAVMLEELAAMLEHGEDPAVSGTGLLDTRRIPRHIESELQCFAQRLLTDVLLRERINRLVRSQLLGCLLRQRAPIGGLVRRVVLSWDEHSLTDRIELHVGRDLQFIRINGTLVGGGVGLLLHAAGRILAAAA